MRYKILKYTDFLKESLSVNNDVKILSEFLYSYLKDKPLGLYKIYNNIPEIFNASEITVSIVEKNDKYVGELDVTESKLKNDKWIFHLNIVKKSNIDVYYHEVNHLLQLSKRGKKDMIKDINRINSFKNSNITFFKNIFIDFCRMIYLSSNMELDSIVAETYARIKHIFNEYHENQNINNDMFIYYVKQTNGWDISLKLINFKFDNTNLDSETLYKFLCYAEKIKDDLDKTKIDSKSNQSNKLTVILKSFWYAFNTLKQNNIKPTYNIEYYEKYINSQGRKLQHKLMKLYGHFDIDSGINLKDTQI